MVDWTALESDTPAPMMVSADRLRQEATTTHVDRIKAMSQITAKTTDNESTLSKLSREADILLHGITVGAAEAGFKKITEQPGRTGLEFTAGVAIGATLSLMQRKAGWVKLGAEILGVSMVAVAAKDIAESGHVGNTARILESAWNDPNNQNYYKTRAANEIGSLTFDTAMMIGAGALGAKGSRMLVRERPSLLNSGDIPSVYKRAEVYDVAFSYRNVPKEADALTAWYSRMTGKPRPESVVELAAGPARHAREFQRRGINSSMLDNSPEMVQFARAASARDGVQLSNYITGDMAKFRLPAKTDMAVTMLDSVGHLRTDAAMVAHLKSVGVNLKPGGVYVMEINNPTARLATTQSRWTAKEGGTSVDMQWGRTGDPFNPATGLRTHTVDVNATTPGGPVKFTEKVTMREWNQASLDRAIQNSGYFDRITRYGDFAPDALYNPADSWRLIYVLRRKP